MPTLFLHMGPGMNAFPERELLGSDAPETAFWDQPSVRGPRAYEDLVDATKREVVRLADSAGEPVRVIAHSFGGNLLRPLLREIPDRVAEIELINCGIDVVRGFARLLEIASRNPETPPALAARERAWHADQVPSRENVFEMIGLIAEDPRFQRLYWPSPAAHARYDEVARRGGAFDFETFHAVIDGYLRNDESIPTRMAWKGNAKLILGREDPLNDPSETADAWRTVLPSIAVEVVPNSGHFTHLERVLRDQ